MDFDCFVKEFIINLINDDKKCIEILENNKKLIEAELSKDSNPKSVNRFVAEINNTIIQNKKRKFKLHEEILKHDELKYVYCVFRKSDVLIQACKYENEKAAEWLLTMNIDPYVQDEEGMTALMYAVKNSKPICIIKSYANDYKGLNMEDKNGNNVLFHSIYTSNKIISYLKDADINHINHDGETILLYCCKNKLFIQIQVLFEIFETIDLNIPDKSGKTVTMYLVENQKTDVFKYIDFAHKKLAFNYVNEHGESVLSLLIKKMYGIDAHHKFDEQYIQLITFLIKVDANFNTVVDEDGNTALMAFLLAGDYETFYYVIKYSHNLDFTKMNKYGENVTSLILKLNILSYYKENKNNHFYFISKNEAIPIKNVPLLCSFDFKYVDPVTKNTSLILAVINGLSFLIPYIIKNNYSSINSVNIHQENALIIAAKMNKYDIVPLLLKTHIQVNQQDDMGNTALHYAVQNRNVPMINNLVKQGADVDIENNEGETALKIGKDLNNVNVLKALHGNLSLSELNDEIKAMREIQAEIQHQYIKEYLYMRVSNLYQKMTSENLNELKTHYYNIMLTISNKLKYINYNNYYETYELTSTISNNNDELPLLTLFLK